MLFLDISLVISWVLWLQPRGFRLQSWSSPLSTPNKFSKGVPPSRISGTDTIQSHFLYQSISCNTPPNFS